MPTEVPNLVQAEPGLLAHSLIVEAIPRGAREADRAKSRCGGPWLLRRWGFPPRAPSVNTTRLVGTYPESRHLFRRRHGDRR
jgi:hypothetical protein